MPLLLQQIQTDRMPSQQETEADSGAQGALQTQGRQSQKQPHAPNSPSEYYPRKDLLFFQLPLASSLWAPTLRPATCLQGVKGKKITDFSSQFSGTTRTPVPQCNIPQ